MKKIFTILICALAICTFAQTKKTTTKTSVKKTTTTKPKTTAKPTNEIKPKKMEDKKDTLVLVETAYGNMTIKLYDETPQHKANFLKLVNEGFYTDLLFHRIIKGFMIQGGDPNSKNAPIGKSLGSGGLNYTVPAEFNTTLFHKKGALAAARTGDQINPLKASSSCQFYIVQGKKSSEQELKSMTQYGGAKYTTEQLKTYSEIGGVPFLDQQYTVFGEVVEGLDVIDKIAAVKTLPGDRPQEDVKMTMKVVVK